MKRYLTALGVLAIGTAFGQEINVPLYKDNKKGPGGHEKEELVASSVPGKLSHILLNGNKVYLLPIDNMPCVVPEMPQSDAGVVRPKIRMNNIPNPRLPKYQKGIPLTPEKMKEFREYLEKQKSSR